METPIVFDPSIEELNKIVAATSLITASDLSDDTQIAIVRENRIALRDVRIRIEKAAKTKREEALKFQKDVIAYEKELLSIISPEEQRLKTLEDEANQIKERAARAALLPMRREQLNGLIEYRPEDNFLLDMDNDEFITYLNTKKAEKLDRDTAELKAREAAIADKERLAQVAEAARVAERNRLESQERSDAAALEKKNAFEKQQIELAAQAKIDEANAELAKAKAQEEARLREIEVREQQAKDEAARRERDTVYQGWLKEIGYTDADKEFWIFKDDGGFVRAFRHVGMFLK